MAKKTSPYPTVGTLVVVGTFDTLLGHCVTVFLNVRLALAWTIFPDVAVAETDPASWLRFLTIDFALNHPLVRTISIRISSWKIQRRFLQSHGRLRWLLRRRGNARMLPLLASAYYYCVGSSGTRRNTCIQ